MFETMERRVSSRLDRLYDMWRFVFIFKYMNMYTKFSIIEFNAVVLLDCNLILISFAKYYIKIKNLKQNVTFI